MGKRGSSFLLPPRNLLDGLLWVFDSTHYSTVGEFAEAVRAYQVTIRKDSSWV